MVTIGLIRLRSSLTGDMLKSVYDPAGINEQLVGLTAIQVLTNKTINTSDNNITVNAADVSDLDSATVVFSNKTVDLSDNTLTGTKSEFNTACSDGNFVYGGDNVTSLTGTKANFDSTCTDGNFVYTGDSTGHLFINLQPGNSATLADATNYFFTNSDGIAPTTSYNILVTMLCPGIVKNVGILMLPGTAGSAETSSIYVRVNNTTDNLIASDVNLSTIYAKSVNLSVALSTGDTFDIKWTTPTWATNPLNVAYWIVINVETHV